MEKGYSPTSSTTGYTPGANAQRCAQEKSVNTKVVSTINGAENTESGVSKSVDTKCDEKAPPHRQNQVDGAQMTEEMSVVIEGQDLQRFWENYTASNSVTNRRRSPKQNKGVRFAFTCFLALTCEAAAPSVDNNSTIPTLEQGAQSRKSPVTRVIILLIISFMLGYGVSLLVTSVGKVIHRAHRRVMARPEMNESQMKRYNKMLADKEKRAREETAQLLMNDSRKQPNDYPPWAREMSIGFALRIVSLAIGTTIFQKSAEDTQEVQDVIKTYTNRNQKSLEQEYAERAALSEDETLRMIESITFWSALWKTITTWSELSPFFDHQSFDEIVVLSVTILFTVSVILELYYSR